MDIWKCHTVIIIIDTDIQITSMPLKTDTQIFIRLNLIRNNIFSDGNQ